MCSPSSDISISFCESISRNKNLNSIVPRAFTRFGDLRKNYFQIHEGVVKKVVVSSHVAPDHLEGSYVGNKQLNEPSSKVGFMRTLLIDNYDSYTYNIFQELAVINGVPPVVIRNDEWSWEEICHYLYEVKAFDNIVISPGPGSPTCDVDIGICLRLLLECRDIPILGVCLGHQALGYVHGAEVVQAPEPVHGRLSNIEHNGSGLFHGIPSGLNSGFKAVRYHSLVIDPSSLPKELIPIAWTSSSNTTPFHGIQNSDISNGLQWHSSRSLSGKILMGIMHSSRPHYGLQFHPESIATCHGRQIFKNFADITKDYWFRLRSSTLSKRKVPYAEQGSVFVYGGQRWLTLETIDIYVAKQEELQSFCYDAADYEGLPFDFYGGYIGYIGYDLKVECGVSTNHHKSSVPDACLFFTDNLVVIDHHCDNIYIMSIIDDTKTSTTSWLDHVEQKLLNMKLSPPKKSRVSVENTQRKGFSADKSREQYIEDIIKCQQFIKDGESYELCLTTQMRTRVRDINSLGLYLNLREINPAPYAAWLNFPKENLCICCSSPERFLRLDRNGVLEAKPIKGTLARGVSPEEDEMQKLRLQYSEKDQAENLMIVDLLRNDLGRVCEPGSVHVPNLMEIESYATVHTMVSTIQGKKRSNMSAVDCVRAAFPGGSMTGAPKLRSMEILDSLESCSRGIYSGCIGYFSYNQTFDLNIVIRSIVIHKGEASIGAGGAITALSNCNDEYEEMVLKTRAPTNVVMEYQNSTCLERQKTGSDSP
ncbi:hypothetical protein RD792_005822 [Penstemon davidsonii]|uniref:aminodeoxychorismate synthase n=1 Tax=Penstemon davidsonii TaxID=160366 RepID=A0ABR0DE62_9LAMI|nr:hypothetical protein RD792_005822 [Penstemon davidsonii]